MRATAMRFYALWLREFGELNVSPNKIIADSTDWRFLDELKRELRRESRCPRISARG